MSYNFSRNEFDLDLEELNELFRWVDSEPYEVGESSNHNTIHISSPNTFDLDFTQPNKQFGYFSLEELDQTFEKLNKQFFWDDNADNKLLEVDDKKLNKQFFWDDNADNKLLEVDDKKLNKQLFWDDNADNKLYEADDSNLSEQFLWDDDLFSVEIFDSAFEKINKLFSTVDDCQEYENGAVYDISWDETSPRDTGFSCLDTFSEPVNIGSVFGSSFGIDDEFARNEFNMSDEKVFDDVDEINAMLRQLTCVAVEPERKEEEDDLYTSCRKDAIKMMSTATRHLNEAKNCFLRGDHISAKRLSEKAKEERKTAENLHSEAAREILSIKNKNNGLMKLDLHCLRVKEAIQAVKERLHKIENHEVLIYLDEQAFGKLKKRQLEVITGRGKHSPGKPKLPAAVRSFLKENGYEFDGSRPGVIMVRPKFYASWLD